MQWEDEVQPDRLRATAELARLGTVSQPAVPGNWLILARSLHALGKPQEATALLRQALELLPPSAELQTTLAQALAAQDLFDEALPHARAAMALAPSDRNAKRVHYEVLAALGLWNEASLDMDAVAAFSPSNSLLLEMHARALPLDARLELCNRHLAADPAHTNAIYLKAITLAALGRLDEARGLIDVDRLIEAKPLPSPAGPAFREALAAEIRANPTLARDHKNKAVRDGQRTRTLSQSGSTAIGALLAGIRTAVDTYITGLAASACEFARGCPETARLRPWAVVYDGTGRQKAHRHPDGWLSGVYYVSAPRTGAGWGGALVLGALDPVEHGFEPPWGTRHIEPEPGRLVLFPSYVPHAAEPCGVDGSRICVAFDVVPVRKAAAASV